jgi:protein-tyrosine-phosphatase
LSAPHHRSQQIERHHVEAADLVIALAPEHVEWIRREHPDAAWRTATLKRLARDLPASGTMWERLRGLRLDLVSLEPWEEVVDPGGGEVEDFISCAVEVVEVLDGLIERF